MIVVAKIEGKPLRAILNLHKSDKIIEQVAGIMRAGRSFGVVLHRKSPFASDAHALDGLVVEVDVRHFHAVGSGDNGIFVDAETVILAGNFTPTGNEVFDRMIDAAVAVVHFVGGNVHRQRQNLMTQTNAEQGQVFSKDGFGGLHGVAHRSRVARTVRKKITIWIPSLYLLQRRLGRKHLQVAIAVGEALQYIALDAIIIYSHPKSRIGIAHEIRLGRADDGSQFETLHIRHGS